MNPNFYIHKLTKGLVFSITMQDVMVAQPRPGLAVHVPGYSRTWLMSLVISLCILYWIFYSISSDYNLWTWCSAHVFSLTVSCVGSWGTARSELGKVVLKMQEMPFQASKNSVTSYGPCPFHFLESLSFSLRCHSPR